jgi:NADH:ubiquinone oxidoreductase subunit C
MTAVDAVIDRLAAECSGTRAVDARTPALVDVPAASWSASAEVAHEAGFVWFDSLTGLDDGDGGLDLLLIVTRPGTPLVRVGIRTSVPLEGAVMPPTIVDAYAGAAWSEREVAEMFGMVGPHGVPAERLLLHSAFTGAPLRKAEPLAARATRPWPGAKDPGESDADVAPDTGTTVTLGAGAAAASTGGTTADPDDGTAVASDAGPTSDPDAADAVASNGGTPSAPGSGADHGSGTGTPGRTPATRRRRRRAAAPGVPDRDEDGRW